MVNLISRHLLVFVLALILNENQEIEKYFNLKGLTETGDDWQVTSVKVNDESGHIKLHQDKWLMYFLHWRPLTEEKKNLSIKYTQNLLLNFWGQAINFELNHIEGEIEINGHKAFFSEATFGKGSIYTRFIVWNCPQTNRQFVADCNINLRRGTPKEMLEVQKLITQTVCCHPQRTQQTVPGLSQKYESRKWNLSFFIPENWKTADFPDKEWFPEGMTVENGSLWTLLTDSEKHLELLWEKTDENISPALFDKFLGKIVAESMIAPDSSRITDIQMVSLKEEKGYYLGCGTYKYKQYLRDTFLIYDYSFKGIFWREKKRAYFLLTSLIQLKEFWGVKNDLTPSERTFSRYLKDEIIPNLKVFNQKLSVGESQIGDEAENLNQLKAGNSKIDAVFETIKSRRTIREFKSTPLPREDILKILDAARYAPTAGNVQPWKFVLIQNRARLDSLKQLLQANWSERINAKSDLDEEKRKSYIENGKDAIQMIMTAPVYIMVFVDTTIYPKYALYDGCLAVENLMLSARALGYGTGFFTTYFPEGVVKSFVKSPDNLKFICATPLGVPEEWPETPPKKGLDEFIIYESFEK